MKIGKKVAMIVASLGIIGMLKTNVFATSVTYSGEADEIDRTQTQSTTIVGDEFSYMVETEGVYVVGYNGSSKDVIIPEKINGINVYAVYSEAFSWGTFVETVTIPKTVKSIYSDAFINCLTLRAIYVDSENTTYSAENGILYSKDKSYLVVCPSGKKGEITINSSCKSICDNAFFNVEGITKINLPTKLFEVGDAAIYDTPNLSQLTLDSNNKYYKITDGVLYQRNIETGKEEIAIKCPDARINPVTIPSTVNEIAMYAFFNCKNLKGPINIPNNVETIGEGAFWNCKSLTGDIVIPDNTSTIGKGAFYECNSISSVKIGSRITDIPEDCFGYCTSLKEITIPDKVIDIGDRAFFYCTGVEKLKLSENLKTIGDWAFDYLTNLKGNVVIPDYVTKIGTNAFEHSKNIDGYIIIGKNVATMGENVFRTANNAKAIVFKGNVPLFSKHTFDEPTDLTYYHLKNAFGFEYTLENKKQDIYSENPEIKYMVNGEVYKTQRLNTFGIPVPLIDDPVVEKYVFAGWYEDEACSVKYNEEKDIMNDITLYAKLEKSYYIEPLEDNLLIEITQGGKIDLKYSLEEDNDQDIITFESLNNNIAKVDENGNITPIAGGETTILVKYKEITKEVNVTVWKDQNALSFATDTLDMQVNKNETPIMNYHFVNGEFRDIVWTVEDPTIVSCSNGRIYALKEGSTTVTASYEDVSATINVNVYPQSYITMNVNSTCVQVGEKEAITLDYYFFKDTSDSVVWETSNKDVGYFKNGEFIAVAPGNVAITVSHDDLVDSILFTVVPHDYVQINEDTEITIENTEETYAITYDFYSYFTDVVEWSSTNPSVAEVTDNGVLIIKGLGDTIIEAKVNNETDYLAVHVVRPNTIILAESESVIRFSENEEVIIDVDYFFNDGANGDSIVYTSSNPSVIAVEDGKLIQKGIGQTVITVSYKTARDTEKITVVPQDYVEFEKSSYLIGLTDQVKANINYFIYDIDNPEITFTSLDEDVVQIDNEGVMTPIAEGKTTIKVVCNGIEAEVDVTVKDLTHLKGDVNQDGAVNVEDAALVLDFYKYNNATELQFYLGDINEDGALNVEDAGLILDMYKGII